MIGVFGGTFDPIHFGHLRCAWEIAEQLELRELRMLPARLPPHRDPPLASADQRRRLLELALAGQSLLRLDTRELERDGPSYMVDTLRSLRAELGDEPVCLILGQDAFNSLDGWHRWEAIPGLAHLVVVTRPGSTLVDHGPIRDLVERCGVECVDALRARPAGAVLARTVTPLAISASGIRDLLAAGHSPRYLLPDAVLDCVQRERMYLNFN
ncbi:MAG: nicotinate-nucleotide adenylyltransferase [Gammaproteobacteria bacterium]|nr:nicotinate-nucleotide adenylyltransferase [Gammaproteobacteria bacterium]